MFWPMTKRYHLKIFLFFMNPSSNLSGLSNSGRGLAKELLCEIILSLDHWCRRRRLKLFLISSSFRHFSLAENTIFSILVEGNIRNIEM